ncbi:uncharacterized protein AMSG_05615 [Thecamonas trahens ATCC 50062]|uniref:Uncharacterized protein n=1 Tax=Thecamonas trahens ATCC 50062 TaxID=461836 RepID=A0A0L0DB74_THETB|nr:hypothetical protein AMSG_05615 [Thecamonas trahens ATCC 50062]KNC49579.1 hypothetical protein AMSG_05615 [Thecamonas trahens ATCC 50062]|eukprot:XP_013757688.1 hypothetical protein AMSG_05615 [Thecamonas trahens ATCC 50062]
MAMAALSPQQVHIRSQLEDDWEARLSHVLATGAPEDAVAYFCKVVSVLEATYGTADPAAPSACLRPLLMGYVAKTLQTTRLSGKALAALDGVGIRVGGAGAPEALAQAAKQAMQTTPLAASPVLSQCEQTRREADAVIACTRGVNNEVGGVLDGEFGSWLDAYTVGDATARMFKINHWAKALDEHGNLTDAQVENTAVTLVQVAIAHCNVIWARFRVRPASVVWLILRALDILDTRGLFQALADSASDVAHELFDGWLHELHPLVVRNRVHALAGQIMISARAGAYTDALLQWTRLEGEEESLNEMVPDAINMVSDAIAAIKSRFAVALQAELAPLTLSTDGKALSLLTAAVVSNTAITAVASRYAAALASIRGPADFAAALARSEANSLGPMISDDVIAWEACSAQLADSMVATQDIEYVYRHLIFSLIRQHEYLAADMLLQALVDRITADVAAGSSIERGQFTKQTEAYDPWLARRIRVRGIRHASSPSAAFAAFLSLNLTMADMLEDEHHPVVHMALACYDHELQSGGIGEAGALPDGLVVSVEWLCASCFSFLPHSAPMIVADADGVQLCSTCAR